MSESLINIGSSTLLGALIGEGATGLLAREGTLPAAAKALDQDRAEIALHSGAQPVGAAATDTRQVELAPSFGVGKVTAGFDPVSRGLNAQSVAARRATVDLAETPLLTKENLEGIPTTTGPALDRSARLAINQTRVAVSDEINRLFAEYRFGSTDVTAPRLRAQFQDFMGRSEGFMSPTEFKAAVSKALTEGDKSDIPQVQSAAEFVRRKVFDPWKDRAINAGLLPEGVDVKTAESYFQRVYNKQAIAAKRPEFVNTVQGWLKSDQQTKAAAKDRLTGYHRDLEAAQGKVAGAKTEETRIAAEADHAAVRAKIEAEIAAWEGKSTGEAKAALKAREKYAAEREREEGAPRLESADSAVDRAVKRIIASDRDLSDAELRSRAHEITERILGSPDGRLPYDMASGGPEVGYHAAPAEPPRGALAARTFNIPDATIRPFLEQDVEHVINTHLKTMVPDVLLAERFGDVRMTETFRKIEDDYAGLIDATKSEKQRTALEKERENALRDIAGIRDRIRGVYGMDVFNSMRGAARVAGAVKNYNVLTSMGMATVSSLPDAAGAIFRYGLGTVFRDAYVPFVKSLMSNRELSGEATRQFRAMGIAVESIFSQRAHAMTDVMDSYRPHTKLERTLQWGADKFQMLNLLAPWTDAMKVAASTVASQEIFRAAEALTKGTATARQARSLAENGIDAATAERIATEYRASGKIIDGVHLPNTDQWAHQGAREAFEGAVAREADIAVVTPGQEKPLWLSNPIVSVLGQFKSFTAAATQRILLANLQRRDAQVLQGVMASMALGMVSYKVNSILGGQPTSDRPQDWIKESMSRGNLFGWFEEGNALASKMTRGGVDAYRMLGADKPLSRYAGRSVLDQMLGPTSGKIEALSTVTGAMGARDWTETDTKALRKLTAFQNLFYLRNLLNQVETGADGAFGIPMKSHTSPNFAGTAR